MKLFIYDFSCKTTDFGDVIEMDMNGDVRDPAAGVVLPALALPAVAPQAQLDVPLLGAIMAPPPVVDPPLAAAIMPPPPPPVMIPPPGVVIPIRDYRPRRQTYTQKQKNRAIRLLNLGVPCRQVANLVRDNSESDSPVGASTQTQ